MYITNKKIWTTKGRKQTEIPFWDQQVTENKQYVQYMSIFLVPIKDYIVTDESWNKKHFFSVFLLSCDGGWVMVLPETRGRVDFAVVGIEKAWKPSPAVIEAAFDSDPWKHQPFKFLSRSQP